MLQSLCFDFVSARSRHFAPPRARDPPPCIAYRRPRRTDFVGLQGRTHPPCSRRSATRACLVSLRRTVCDLLRRSSCSSRYRCSSLSLQSALRAVPTALVGCVPPPAVGLCLAGLMNRKTVRTSSRTAAWLRPLTSQLRTRASSARARSASHPRHFVPQISSFFSFARFERSLHGASRCLVLRTARQRSLTDGLSIDFDRVGSTHL